MNTAYLDMIQGKNPGVTPVWYMRQAGRSQAEYRKIKEKYTLFEITKEPDYVLALRSYLLRNTALMRPSFTRTS